MSMAGLRGELTLTLQQCVLWPFRVIDENRVGQILASIDLAACLLQTRLT